MSKAVLVSIIPWWCLEIAHGNKTVEVRKNKPNIPTPFKTYIYVTKKRPLLAWGDVFRGNWETEFTTITGRSFDEASRIWDIFNGKIMGEFVCDTIDWHCASEFIVKEDRERALAGTCLTRDDIYAYLNWTPGMSVYDKKGEFYGWHISDLVIYDYPKKLSDFRLYNTSAVIEHGLPMPTHEIKRPPQSWCYVEELL